MWLWPVFGSYRHEWLKSHVTMAIGQNTNVDQDILYLFRGINLNDSWCNHSILLDILDMRIKARKMDIYPSSKYENDPLIRKTKNGIFIWKDIMDPIMTLTKDTLLLNIRVSIVSKDERSYKSDVYCIITFVCTKQIRPRRSARHENTPISHLLGCLP